MTAQEEGMLALSMMAREICPPQLDYVVLVFNPDHPNHFSSVLSPSDVRSPTEQVKNAKIAAAAFVEKPVDPSFHSPNN